MSQQSQPAEQSQTTTTTTTTTQAQTTEQLETSDQTIPPEKKCQCRTCGKEKNIDQFMDGVVLRYTCSLCREKSRKRGQNRIERHNKETMVCSICKGRPFKVYCLRAHKNTQRHKSLVAALSTHDSYPTDSVKPTKQ
jgi:hypothetical protein